MFRLPIIHKKDKLLNLIIAPWLHVRSSIDFDLKKPRELLKFHADTGIKSIKTFVLFGFGWEIITFFNNNELVVLTKLVGAAADVVKHEVAMNE